MEDFFLNKLVGLIEDLDNAGRLKEALKEAYYDHECEEIWDTLNNAAINIGFADGD